jgi:hypothetical protein
MDSANQVREAFIQRWRFAAIRYAPLVGIVLAGLALRLWIVAGVGLNPNYFDVDGYHAQAIKGLSGTVPTDYHPPGYPWFLIAIYKFIGPQVRVVYALQALLSSAAVLLVGWAVQRRYGFAGGCLAATLLAFSGYLAIFPSALGSENLCFFGVGILVAILLSKPRPISLPRLLAAAVLVGGLSLVRTTMLGLAPGVALLAVLSNNRSEKGLTQRVAVAAMVMGISLVPAAVFGVVRWEREGYFRFGSPFDVYNFWVGNNPHATGRIDAMPDVPKVGTAELPDEEARARLLGPRAWRYALTHPLHEAVLLGKRTSYLFAPPKRDLIYIYGWGWAGERSPSVIVATYIWAASSVPLLIVCILLSLAWKGCEPAFWSSLALMGFALTPYLISLGDARFLMPLHPLLAFAAGSLLRPVHPARSLGRWLVVGALLGLYGANTFFDLRLTQPALEAIMLPGGSQLHPPYHFAR